MTARYTFIGSGDAALSAELNSLLTRIEADMKPPYYAKASLPTDGSIRTAIVTDEAGGEVMAFFTSSNQWRRVTDRAVVS